MELIWLFNNINMKNKILIVILGAFIYSCENFEITHPDFDYTSGYFPYQYQVRTLVLGDYIYDNSNDNSHKFIISVAMGGVYENKIDRRFVIEKDETLCENLLIEADGDTLKALPANYYTLSNNDEIIIPKGSFNGGVEVQLTEQFFNDANAIKNNYVIPLRIISSSDVDSILTGQPAVRNPDFRNASDWIVEPKNFTLFAVKYINEYHGTYFHFGENKVKDIDGYVIDNNTYSEKHLIDNKLVKIVTVGRNEVEMTLQLNSDLMKEEQSLLLNFEGDNCTISSTDLDNDYT